MSMQPNVDPRFVLDFADRLALAQRRSRLTVNEIADRIEVHRNTVGGWINGRQRPRSRDLKAFAMATGYPLQWLETGEAPHDGGAPDPSHLRESNPRPIHYMRTASHSERRLMQKAA